MFFDATYIVWLKQKAKINVPGDPYIAGHFTQRLITPISCR
jgi:hypothetical protein